LNRPQEPGDFAPSLGGAQRAMIGAMMARLTARGFDGMTPTFASLIPLLDAGGARATVLAQRSGVTKQAMSQLIRELEKRGYVEQVPDETDTRAKLVRLTPRGVALRAACFEARGDLQALATKALGAEALAQLQRSLSKLAQALAAPPAPAGRG
jgi:DNA-binding MarR family transcriptional regulator